MMKRGGRTLWWLAAAPLTLAAGAALADAHWTAGNVNAVNRLLGSRSGWQFAYLPPPDADLPPPDADRVLLGALDRHGGLDQWIAVSTLPPPDADLPPPDADRQLHVLVPGDGTSPTTLGWQDPPEPERPASRSLAIAFPTDASAPVQIDLLPPPDADHPPDPGHAITIAYPPDPGVPIDIVIPAGVDVTFHDALGNDLRLCGAVGDGTGLDPGGR